MLSMDIVTTSKFKTLLARVYATNYLETQPDDNYFSVSTALQSLYSSLVLETFPFTQVEHQEKMNGKAWIVEQNRVEIIQQKVNKALLSDDVPTAILYAMEKYPELEPYAAGFVRAAQSML